MDSHLKYMDKHAIHERSVCNNNLFTHTEISIIHIDRSWYISLYSQIDILNIANWYSSDLTSH